MLMASADAFLESMEGVEETHATPAITKGEVDQVIRAEPHGTASPTGTSDDQASHKTLVPINEIDIVHPSRRHQLIGNHGSQAELHPQPTQSSQQVPRGPRLD
jgi:hypothetical protein